MLENTVGFKVSHTVVYISAHGVFTSEEIGIKPVPADMPGVKGVYVGGCVNRGVGRLSLKTSCPVAHAHNDRRDEHFGWVCFQTPSYFKDEAIRLHELAHINTPGHGHDDTWRSEMTRLGQIILPRYRRRQYKKRS